jgi:hypothetical protein
MRIYIALALYFVLFYCHWYLCFSYSCLVVMIASLLCHPSP